MKSQLFKIFIALSFTSLYSCEKVIDLDIDDSEKKVVIEAELKAGTHLFEVLLSESTFYNETFLSTPLENAIITLEDNQGLSTLIPYIANGKYQETITAEAGKTYTLTVSINGEQYTASSSMPAAQPIQNLTSIYEDFSFDGSTGYIVKCHFQDPLATTDFYRIRHTINQVQQNQPRDYVFFNDELVNGLLVSRTVSRELISPGDTVLVELIHLDEAGFDFISTLGDIIGSSPTGGSAAPGNPITNWSNDAIGAFNAYNIDTMSIVIP